MRRFLLLLGVAVCGIVPALGQFSDSVTYIDPQKRALLANPYGWGYIAGTNRYGDIGKYQRFEVFETPYLAAARVYFGLKRIVGSPDTISVVVRDASPAGPGARLTSVKITTDKLDTTGKGNLFFFPMRPQFQGGVFYPDSLYIGIEWAETVDDTFAVFADSNGFGEKMQRVWEQINYNNQWTMWPWINSPDPNFEWAVDSDLWIKAYLSTSPTAVAGNPEVVPTEFALEQNYPNPFNPSTSIRYFLPEQSVVQLRVCNILGQVIASLAGGVREAGVNNILWDASGFASGLYLCRLEAATTRDPSRTFNQTRKMVLTK